MRITWRDRFPRSMLSDMDKLSEASKKLRNVRNGYKAQNFQSIFPSEFNDEIDCNEVYPDIFLGDGYTAKNLKFLKKIGITHVVNTAMGPGFTLVDTNERFYAASNIKFLGFSINDTPMADISVHFESVANFIETALSSRGKVYVHCFMGISRSSSCIIAFLMLKRGMTAEDAFKTCRDKRFICPNDGFIRQLAELDIKLQERRDLQSSTVQEQNSTKKHCDMS